MGWFGKKLSSFDYIMEDFKRMKRLKAEEREALLGIN